MHFSFCLQVLKSSYFVPKIVPGALLFLQVNSHKLSRMSQESEQPSTRTTLGEEKEEEFIEAKPTSKGQVDLKLIKMPVFDGTTPDLDFDAGARLWFRRLAMQIRRAQALSEQAWSEKKKIAVIGQFLAGAAADWFDEFTDKHAETSFDEAGAMLVAEFKPVLTDPEIMKRIQEEKKKPSETYREYAGRLRNMANAMDGGMEDVRNGRAALDTFIKTAWPRYTNHLRGKISIRTDKPDDMLSQAVMELTEFAGTDGKLREIKRKREDREERHVKRPPMFQTHHPARANAVVVERKQKPTGRRDFSKIRCFECNQMGHTAAYHRRFLSKTEGETKTQVNPSQQ